MAEKAVPHVYSAVNRIDFPQPGHRLITLDGDVWFQLGADAETFYRDLQCGDLILIDLADWDSKGYAHLYAYRPRTDICGRNAIGSVKIHRSTSTSFD